MQVRREAVEDISRSVERRSVGVWGPTGLLAVTLDITLFRPTPGADVYDPPPAGALLGATVSEASASAAAGTLQAYDHPPSNPGTLQPLAWCEPEDWVRDAVPSYDRAVPPADLGAGLGVTVRFSPPLDGSVTEAVEEISCYPAPDPHVVPVFKVTLPGSMVNRTQLGAAVVARDDAGLLVGFVLMAATKPGGESVLTCYPAHELGA